MEGGDALPLTSQNAFIFFFYDHLTDICTVNRCLHLYLRRCLAEVIALEDISCRASAP